MNGWYLDLAKRLLCLGYIGAGKTGNARDRSKDRQTFSQLKTWSDILDDLVVLRKDILNVPKEKMDFREHHTYTMHVES